MTEVPSLQQIEAARQAFEANEPRDLFYRAATELVDLALQGRSSLSVAEALAVLLQTWNKPFYHYRKFDTRHFEELERLLGEHQESLLALRDRSIEGFGTQEESQVRGIFKAFEDLLGPVGAAKCLHLIAPRFFPLWDRAIAAAYDLGLQRTGENADRYCRFMFEVREQILHLGGEDRVGRNPLKALDEYNYCKYTKKWI